MASFILSAGFSFPFIIIQSLYCIMWLHFHKNLYKIIVVMQLANNFIVTVTLKLSTKIFPYSTNL